MSSKKCLYKSNNQNEDESDSLASPCFVINRDVELKDVPATGEEYLLTVIKERQNYSFVTKCNKDYSKFARNQSCFVEEVPHAKAPVNLKPTIEWQNMQVADFSDVRMYMSRMLAKKSLCPTKITEMDLNPNNVAAWKNMFDRKVPTLSCLLGFHSSLIDRGFEILIQVLDEVKPGCGIKYKTGKKQTDFLMVRNSLRLETPKLVMAAITSFALRCQPEAAMSDLEQKKVNRLPYPPNQHMSTRSNDLIAAGIGQWIYALLACVRQPLLSDTISILRDLARKCAEVRSHLDPELEDSEVAVVPLNIFICLVARYFRQYDLAD